MGFLGECAKRHGTCHKVAYDVFDGFHLGDVDGIAAEVEEVAQEDGVGLLVDGLCEAFVGIVVAGTGSELQGSDCFGVPGVAYAVDAVVELSEVGQEVGLEVGSEGLVV